MPCYICNVPVDVLIIDIRDKKLRPCKTCEEISQENLQMISKKKKEYKSLLDDELLEEEFDFEEVLEIDKYQRVMDDEEYFE